jgi:pimeloyl-ACP methyl ester carboxylesterase
LFRLNSPYYRQPELFKCGINDLITSYLAEVRRRQPSGPYSFGGWSAGGILAYRAAQVALEQGERVENLVLVDSPVPKGLDRLPQHFYDYCNKMHIFGQTAGTGQTPEWLVPHFNATIDALHTYFALPLPIGKAPRVSLIWACESVIDGKHIPAMPPRPEDTEGMKFLTEFRTDFSGNGWEKLFRASGMIIERAVGANHFTMMVSYFSSSSQGLYFFLLTW